MTKLTRREFIKLSGSALAGVACLPLPPHSQDTREKAHMGRITEWSVWARTEPAHDAPHVRHHQRDDIITYFEKVKAEGCNPHNPIWFRVIDGYIYSSYVQPVEMHLNTPLQYIPSKGLWGEISIPYTEAHYAPSPDAYRTYRLYYSSVHHVVEAMWGEDHQLWYRLRDGQSPGTRRYVPAEHVRLFPPEELRPISPHAPDKQIRISLASQLLEAFEGSRQVFATHISGGTGGDRSTPQGRHHIIFKAPSRHMIGEGYDLPGVPFDSYFWGSVAIHGAYWHNDYGRPRSHGCVNVSSQAARWIFRWTEPHYPYSQDSLRVHKGGTSVIVY